MVIKHFDKSTNTVLASNVQVPFGGWKGLNQEFAKGEKRRQEIYNSPQWQQFEYDCFQVRYLIPPVASALARLSSNTEIHGKVRTRGHEMPVEVEGIVIGYCRILDVQDFYKQSHTESFYHYLITRVPHLRKYHPNQGEKVIKMPKYAGTSSLERYAKQAQD